MTRTDDYGTWQSTDGISWVLVEPSPGYLSAEAERAAREEQERQEFDSKLSNESDLRTKARQAVQANIDSIAQIPAAVTKVQGVIDGTASNLTQANAALDELAVVLRGLLNDYERMLRQLVAVERLIIGSDLLDETTGT